MTTNTKMMLAAAMGGLLAGATSRLSAATPSTVPTGSQISSHSQVVKTSSTSAQPGKLLADKDKDKDKHDCKGKNSCKGKGGCKTGDNGCKGKNSCKGKGGCKSASDDKKV